MLLDKYIPNYSPDAETGAADVTAEAPPITNVEDVSDGPGSGRSGLRRQLERSFSDTNKQGRTAAGKGARGAPRQADEMRREAQAAAGAAESGAEDGQDQQAEDDVTAVGVPPDAWAKDARELWEQLPPAVQHAVTKRESDVARGVAQLKQQYAELDKVIAPRLNAIRQNGQSPAATVNQLFAWWEALASNPDQTVPALLQVIKYDPRRLLQGLVQEQQQPQQPQQQPNLDQNEELLERIKSMIVEQTKPLTDKYSTLEQTFQSANQQKTEEILSNWSKDKPYFEEVRERMAYLIASGAVPPLPNGSADLDTAYDEAVWGMPGVRQKVMADKQRASLEAKKAKQEAERLAQAEQADKARRASGSLSPGGPGIAGAPVQNRMKGKSVRESLSEALEQHRGV